MKHFFYLLLSVFTLFFSCKSDVAPEIVVDWLPSNNIKKIIVDNQGIKWIATDKGLVSFDGTKWKTYSRFKALTGNIITDITFDKMTGKQELWASTFAGIYLNTISTQNLSVYNSYSYTLTGLLSDSVFAVAIDTKDTKFFGTAKGLSILKNDKWTSHVGDWGKSGDDFLSKNRITSIATTKNGWNYVATNGGGVSRFQYTDAVSGATKYFMPWAYGLKSDVIFTVVVVNDTCQWYGTDKGAAYHTSEFTKADWTSFSTAEGLISDSVYAIVQDANGNTWFGTARGVSKLNNTVWTNFTTKDGLIGNKVNTIAIDIDGSVWFGTDNGISQFKNNIWKSFSVK